MVRLAERTTDKSGQHMCESLVLDADNDLPKGYRLLQPEESIKAGDYILNEGCSNAIKRYPKQWNKIVDVGSEYVRNPRTKYCRLDT